MEDGTLKEPVGLVLDVAFFRRWVLISPLFFEILMKFICYGAISTTGLSIRGWLFFKDNEGNALNV